MNIHLNQYLDAHRPKNGRFYTIVIDGRGGAGKTMLGEYLKTILEGFTNINGDDYFEPVTNQIVWGAYNNQRFIDDVIKPIAKGFPTINFRPYNWDNNPHIAKQSPVKIGRGICIERCYSFEFGVDWDLKIWVETPKDICRQRGMARETMPKERVKLAWETVWQPLETKYIEEKQPQTQADIVLNGTIPFDQQLN